MKRKYWAVCYESTKMIACFQPTLFTFVAMNVKVCENIKYGFGEKECSMRYIHKNMDMYDIKGGGWK